MLLFAVDIIYSLTQLSTYAEIYLDYVTRGMRLWANVVQKTILGSSYNIKAMLDQNEIYRKLNDRRFNTDFISSFTWIKTVNSNWNNETFH